MLIIVLCLFVRACQDGSIFSGVHVTWSLVLCACFLDRCLFFCTFSFWPLCCLFFFDLRILITSLISFGHCVVCSSIYVFWLPLWYIVAIVLSFLLWFTDSDYPFGILWPLCCLFFFHLQILIIPLVSCGHCVVCSSTIYRFWLALWYLQTLL